MIDLFVTTKPGRDDLTRRSLESLLQSTDQPTTRITVYVDGREHGCMDLIQDSFEHVIISGQNEGLGPAINRCLAHIDATNRYFSNESGAPDHSQLSDFVVMCQDDLEYSDGWLERLRRSFLLYESRCNLGFASGLECVEHPVSKALGGGMVLKRWIRAAQMFARREYWMSMWPIPRLDLETNRVRARPNDGVGSGVDWWFIRNHPNSVDRSMRSCLVVPGLVRHIGYRESTWLDRNLPESQSDIELMR